MYAAARFLWWWVGRGRAQAPGSFSPPKPAGPPPGRRRRFSRQWGRQFG